LSFSWEIVIAEVKGWITKNSVPKGTNSQEKDASPTRPPDSPLGVIYMFFLFLRVHSNCVCVCVRSSKWFLNCCYKVNVIFKVTKNQGVCFKDLCYKLLKLFTFKYVNILRMILIMK
jgi:hypothetical protein